MSMLVRIGVLVAGAAPLLASAQELGPAHPVRHVLLVGHDPAAPDVTFPQLAKARTHELYRERTAAWAAFLVQHFERVEVVHADAWDLAMSEAADVTIFDACPPALSRSGRSANGARQAPTLADLSFPALTIAERSSELGEDRGLKLDWL